jgi:AcrR family transcriptional regulator
LTMFKNSIDCGRSAGQYLTMFKMEAVGSLPSTTKGEETRRRIFECALELFRENGFDATTMQDVAARAEVVKSAAYYYFPGKEAIIQAYYEAVQAEQERRCEEVFAATGKLRARLGAAMHTKFDLAQTDRKLLGVVFRYTGEAEHPLSCLGRGTTEIRRRAMAVFRKAIAKERLPNDLADLLPLALWALQMGLLVMFLYDDSEGQRRTRKLADGALDLTIKLLGLAKLPLLRPVRMSVLRLLKEAELLPEEKGESHE